MWCSEGSVLQFMRCFTKKLCDWNFVTKIIFSVKRLRAFLCDEVFFSQKKSFLVKTVFGEKSFFERLCDFVCEEVAWFFVWGGCVIFLTQSLRCMIHFSGGCVIFFSGDFLGVIFFCEELAWFFVDRLHGFFGGQVAWFHFLRGCMILCVERLCDFFHSLTQVPWFIFLEVVWFFLRRDCVIFLLRDSYFFFLCVKRLRDFCMKRLHDFSVKKVLLVKQKSFLIKTSYCWKKFFLLVLSLLSLLSLLLLLSLQ